MMTATLEKLAPAQVQSRLASGRAVLVDIREPDEFTRSHIAGARSLPLSAWAGTHLSLDPGTQVIFTCRSGARTGAACAQLAARVEGNACVLDGGIAAWSAAGLPLEVIRSAPIEMNRQVQITAGLLILTGVLLGAFVTPLWYGLAGFVGVGLTFAGLSGTCAMARLLMLAPWNRSSGA